MRFDTYIRQWRGGERITGREAREAIGRLRIGTATADIHSLVKPKLLQNRSRNV